MKQLLEQGMELVFIGLGTVFVFLILLVIAIMLMTKIVQYFPGPAEEQPYPKKRGNNAPKIAAMSAAAIHHQNHEKK